MSTKITILTTNDIHGRFISESNKTIDFASLCTYRKQQTNSLLVDAGDATQGTPLAILNKGTDPITIMNAVGYDAVTIGNHEFDNITKDTGKACELDDIIVKCKAPFICANLFRKKQQDNYIRSVYVAKGIEARGNGRYLIRKIADKTLLFVGVTTPMVSMNIERMQDFDIKGKENNAIENEVKEAIADAKRDNGNRDFDAVILLAHIGKSTSGYNTIELAKNLTNIRVNEVNLIIDGHSHQKYSEKVADTNTTIVQANCNGEIVGKITLDFNAGALAISTEFIEAVTINSYKQDDTVRKVIEKIGEEVKEKFGTVYSSGSNTTLWGGAIDEDKPYVREELEAMNVSRYVQTNMGKLAAEAMIYDVRTNHPDLFTRTPFIIAGINGGGVRDAIPFNKPITGNELFYALPSHIDSEKESGYALFKLNLKQLESVLLNSLFGIDYDEKTKQLITHDGRFLNTAGIRYEISLVYEMCREHYIELEDKAELTCGKDTRLISKHVNFSQDENFEVLLAVPKYIAGGGDGYAILKECVLLKTVHTPLYQLAGEYIKKCSGSTDNLRKPLFYTAVPQDVEYLGFDFAEPKQMTIKVMDNKEQAMPNQLIAYAFADNSGYKNHTYVFADKDGKFRVTPPQGASTMCIGALEGFGTRYRTCLYGELFLHSYFLLSKSNEIECRVESVNANNYVLFNKNVLSQFLHFNKTEKKEHFSNYITCVSDANENIHLSFINNLLYRNKGTGDFLRVDSSKYKDEKGEVKSLCAPFPTNGITYKTHHIETNPNSYITFLTTHHCLDISELKGADGPEKSLFFDGCLFAYNHGLEVLGLHIRCGTILDGIGFIYADNNEFFFGNPMGGRDETFRFKDGEYITTITGEVNLKGIGGFYNCVTNLCLYTNRTKYGPFGHPTNYEPFEIYKANHKIVALIGEEAIPKEWGKKVGR